MCFHWECLQVLVQNIGISTSISNTTQIRLQHFRKVMCVHWECAWCQCRILVLAPAYPTLHKYAHSTSETLCVSTGNVRGASAKYWYQHQHIQHYTSTPTALQKLHVFLLGMCVVLVPNICISTSISNTTQIRPQHFRKVMCVHWECAQCQCRILVLAPAYPTLHKYAHSTSETLCVHWECAWCQCRILVLVQHIQHYTSTPTALQKLHVCLLGMCVVLVPNIGISTSISNITQIRPQQLRNFMCVHWECAWCQCQILVLAPAYPTLHKYAHSTSERSSVSTGKVRGASAEYWYQHQHIQHYTNTPTALQKLYVSTGNVRGASAKYWYQHQRIQHYTNTPTALQKLYVCPLGMCVVLVPNIGISTSISNTTQIRPQRFRKVMCVHWECAWCQCQILVLAPAYPTLHKYAHSTSETLCVSTGNVRGASAKYWYQHQHIQHYTSTPTELQKLHVFLLGMCVVLVPNICISTSISNTTQIRPQHFRKVMCVHWECAQCQCRILVLAPAYPTLHKYAHSTSETLCVHWECAWCQCQILVLVQHIQHYTSTPTALQKLHVCLLGMCVVLVPNIGISTSISNITQIRPQQLRNFMCVHWECAWCQCQILVLAPAYPTLHKYAHSTSERSSVSTGKVRGASAEYWYQHQHIQHYTNTPTALQKLYVSTGNVRGASAKYWYQHQRIQHYTNTPTALQKVYVCPLGMCVVLVPNIGISTSISNTTQIRPQRFRKVMCVHWECAWCQCQILVLAPAYPTLHKYAHSTSETLCVSTGNVRGASAKYWYQHQHIQHYTSTPTALQKLHVFLLGMCVVLVPNICISTSISNTTQIRPQHFRKVMCVHWECAQCQCRILVLAPAYPTLHKYAHSTSETLCVHWECAWCQCQILVLVQHIQHYTSTPTALQKLHVCLLGMCVVLVPNIGISTSISNITQIRPQQLRNFMCVHWECAWCQCQILVLAPAYPTLHKYAHSTSERSSVSTGKVRGASAEYWYQHQHIQHYTNTPTALQKLYVSTGNVRGASAKYWYQHQRIQHYTNTPTALQKLYVCPLGMCVVLVPNIGISTSISNTTQIRPQRFRKVMCVHWECAWCQCQILVLAPAYPTLHKYAHSTSETLCVSTGNVRGASAKYWYQHQHIQHYTSTPTELQKLHVFLLGMCVVLVPNIGISTSISNTTQIRPQHFRKVMCVHLECAWYQCRILVLAPAYPTLHKYAHSS